MGDASLSTLQLNAARRIVARLARVLDARFSVRLWDGSTLPLGRSVDPRYHLAIEGPEVVGSLLRRPTLPNLLEHYTEGRIEIEGGDLFSFGELARSSRSRLRLRSVLGGAAILDVVPLLLTRAPRSASRDPVRSDSDAIRFHYDLSNDFYALFLDPEMQYSCAYFRDWENTLEQAQLDKMDATCRRLRLSPGERLLDVGCGWGGLICYAAQEYGVRAHGVTLSPEQYAYATEKIKSLGLVGRVSVELANYRDLEGEFDKIVSIEMIEHVGIDNYPVFLGKLHGLLRDRGLLLVQTSARRAKTRRRDFRRVRPERRFMLDQIFPNGELDHIGHTASAMEIAGFEVQDIEAWRDHFARTTRLWSERLWARRDEATALVGAERLRAWLAYLAGVSFAFEDGSLRVYQVLATKHGAKGHSEHPPTREDLYHDLDPA
jgi:cyclopropane-fatty-acyl-phospholipid synthase